MHTFCDAISADPSSGTVRGDEVSVVWRREASSSARGVAAPFFDFAAMTGRSVMEVDNLLVEISEDLCSEGAVFKTLVSMPLAVRPDTVSCSGGGVAVGVIAIGAMAG